jgi:hypothetical protein
MATSTAVGEALGAAEHVGGRGKTVSRVEGFSQADASRFRAMAAQERGEVHRHGGQVPRDVADPNIPSGDAAQERGEVASAKSNRGSVGHVGVDDMPPATAADLGLRRDVTDRARRWDRHQDRARGRMQLLRAWRSW